MIYQALWQRYVIDWYICIAKLRAYPIEKQIKNSTNALKTLIASTLQLK